jgi:hypothetical protein
MSMHTVSQNDKSKPSPRLPHTKSPCSGQNELLHLEDSGADAMPGWRSNRYVA